ncbi:ABC transporter substrate-binding protein [Paucibacter sp. Y2R2-4]|uniref:ABC transporter substrate-binding protein n=1 Tax=Paucibacter sp. Y2R2-4 TaxID=2893553 RepID=UPI0021E43850|nr:extracellular solute-binding protein [Paucibacter sp. Y2R2-4]MCV2348680.1 extracellular solute-binding protein [Paucibacter sp. Y2R2-4]
MPHLRRRRLLAAAALAPVTGLAPESQAEASSSNSAAPQRLVVAAFPMVDQIIKSALPAWQKAQGGIEVEVISRQYDDHHTAMTTALSSSSGGAHLPDVMALETMYMGRFSLGAGLQNLSLAPYQAESLREQFVPFAFEQARNRDGAVVALPTDIGPGSLFYRHDLLQRAGLNIKDLCESWESYVQAGVQLKARTGAYLFAHARYLKDIVLFASTPAGQSIYFDAQGKPSITSAHFQRAFQLAQQSRQLGLDAIVDTWRNDWSEHLRRGRLATELSGAWMAGQMANSVAPSTKGLWRVSQLPGQSFAGWGGTYYSIPRRSDPAKKSLAWSLIQYLTLNRDLQLQGFKGQDAFPALLSAHEDPFFDEPVEFLGGQRARQLWREAARRIPARPLHRQNKFAEEVVNGELDNVLIYGKPIPQALADAQALLVHRASR